MSSSEPSTNFNGTAVFSYTISDGSNSATASVTVTVTPVNDAPVANNDTYTTLEDVPLTIPAAGVLANDMDVDGDALTALLVSNVTKGSLNLNANGGFTYTPNTNYNGSDSFTYRARDGSATGNVATVTINITPVNDPCRESTNSGRRSVTIQVCQRQYGRHAVNHHQHFHHERDGHYQRHQRRLHTPPTQRPVSIPFRRPT